VPIALLKTTATGTASQLADSGAITLSFVFTELPDAITAFGETVGFVDALVAALDESESGLIHGPEVGDVFVIETPFGFVARIDLGVCFDDIDLLEEVLDESGLLDDEYVTLVPSAVSWNITEENSEDLFAGARIDAYASATDKADAYMIALDAKSIRTKSIRELDAVLHLPESFENGDAQSLSEFVGDVPLFTAIVDIDAKFTVRS
jgi:hypothetical protein